ncbi:MAG: hypothetical protein AAFV30_04665 [Pseudomonadota bacterium]
MKRPMVIALSAVLSSAAWSDDYNYEVGFGLERAESSVLDTGFATIGPGPGFPSLSIDTETTDFEVSGTWFFDGLSDARGPRSRAAFVDRASSLSLVIGDSSTDTDAVLRIPGGTPPETRDSFESDGTRFGVAGRYVLEPSGWFFTGQIARVDFDTFGTSAELDLLAAGVGKYLGETTTLSLSAARSEIDVSGGGDDSDSGLILEFDHIGGDAAGLQYGVGAVVSNQSVEGSSGSYTVRGSLYPNRDLSLNLSVNGQLGSDPIDATVFSVSGGWFFTEAFEVSAGYTFTEFDEEENVDLDDDSFRLSARYRF